MVQRITLPPGASSPWHRHHDGGVLGVEAGTMSIYGLDHDLCRATDVPAGQAYFVAPHPHHPHLVRNRGSDPLGFVAYYFNVPPGQPASMPEPGSPAACPTPAD